MTTQVAIDGYVGLWNEIQRLLTEGKERARLAVEQETLATYHSIGKLLHEHVLGEGDRAGYGEQTVTRLATDVGLSKTLLYQSLAFFRLQPIFHTCGKLGWSHYRSLLALPSSKAQRFYEDAAVQNGWSVRELEAQIRSGLFEAKETEAATPSQPSRSRRKPLAALRGELYTYRVIDASAGAGKPDLRLDLGFGIQVVPPDGVDEGWRAGDCVTVVRTEEGGYRTRPAEGRQSAFYSYGARVLNVIDGDTLWLDIDCGFYVWTRQKVRLRGIDTPEMGTAEGRRARDFVVEALGGNGKGQMWVAVTTTRPDKYGRYLADVFYEERELKIRKLENENGKLGTGEALRSGKFLNRELLERGLAERL